MSKPLATKVSTPLSENFQIWPFSLRGVLNFVSSGLDINGCVELLFWGDIYIY